MGRMQAQMGFVIAALPIGWVITAGIGAIAYTLVTYLNVAREKEMAILNDPSFTAAQKVSALKTGAFAQVGEALGQAKWVVIGAGILGIAYLYLKGKK